MDFDSILHGLVKYINGEIIPGLNDLQAMAVRVAMERLISRAPDVKDKILTNSWLKTLGVVDANGRIDIDGLATDIKKSIPDSGRLTINVPLICKLNFDREAIDDILRCIKEARI